MRFKLALALILLFSPVLSASVTQFDGGAERTFTFYQPGSVSAFFQIPKLAGVSSASLNVEGLPVLTFSSSSLEGSVSAEVFGKSVAFGTFNSDTYPDLAVGTGKNAVRVFYGTSAGFPASPSLTLGGDGVNDQLGAALAVADMDKDGFDDLIVGAPYGDGSVMDSGAVYVFYGSTSGFSASDNTTVFGDVGLELFGSSLAVCDTDGDSNLDLVVGSPKYDPPTKTDAGRVYIVQGTVSGPSLTVNSTIDGRSAGDNAGFSVACGDLKPDGFSDVVVGAPEYNSGAGRVLVYNSASGVFPANPDLVPIGAGKFGSSLSIGDADKDGFSDLLVGSPMDGNGKVSLFKGASTGVSIPASIVWSGPSSGSQFGYSLSFAGDIDNDGSADVLVGAPASASTGQAFIYFGPASSSGQRIHPLGTGAAGDKFGWWVGPLWPDSDGFLAFGVSSVLAGGKGRVFGYAPAHTLPTDLSIDVAANTTIDYSYPGELSSVQSVSLTSSVSAAVRECSAPVSGSCSVELKLSSASAGQAVLKGLSVEYSLLGLEGEACSSNSTCYSGYCGLGFSNAPAACCSPGRCWDATSSACVPAGFVDTTQVYACETETWSSCGISAQACTSLTILGNELVCVSTGSSFSWVNASSLETGSRCGSGTTPGCDSACASGSCCGTGVCGMPEEASCSVDSDCCEGGCDITGHCCPSDTVFCEGECLPVVGEGAGCDCSSQCPSGTLCSLTSGTCEEGGACSSPSECPLGAVCANNTFNTPAFCCASGQCYDEEGAVCVSSNGVILSKSLICSSGVWASFCRSGTLVVGPSSLVGRCSSDFCGADIECNMTVAGSDVNASLACSSSCNKTGEVLDLGVSVRRCPAGTPVGNCSSAPVVGVNDTVPFGTPVLVNYSVSYPDGSLSDSNFSILVDGVVKKSESASGGLFLLENLTSGPHVLDVRAVHPDYIDSSFNHSFIISRDIAGLVSVSLSPVSVSVAPAGTALFNLSLSSVSSTPIIFIPYSGLQSTLPTSITVPAGNGTSVGFSVTAPSAPGVYPLNLSLTSSEGVLHVNGSVVVLSTEIFSVKLTPVVEDHVLSVIVENNGTSLDSYSLSSCVKTDSVSLAAGQSKTIVIGEISSSCQVCAESSRVRECITVSPVDFEVTIPSSAQFTAGEVSSFYFTTVASEAGTISVSSSVPLFSPFSCSSSCNKSLSFTPSEPGSFEVVFTVSWAEFGLTVRKRLNVTVVEGGSDVSQDRAEIARWLGSLQTDLNALRASGVFVPAASKIVDAVKIADPKSASEVADLLGQLEQAQRYVDLAKKTTLPEGGGVPVLNVVVGVVAIGVGLGALYVVVFRKDLLDEMVSGARASAPPIGQAQQPYTRFARPSYPTTQYQWPKTPAQGPGYSQAPSQPPVARQVPPGYGQQQRPVTPGYPGQRPPVQGYGQRPPVQGYPQQQQRPPAPGPGYPSSQLPVKKKPL